MENQPSESNPSERHGPDTRVPDRKIRGWPIVRQSFSMLFRNVVPFVLLAWGVGLAAGLVWSAVWAVLQALVLAGLVGAKLSRFSIIFYIRTTPIALHALSRGSTEAVISMAVWLNPGGRRLTLKGSLVSVARAIPNILQPRFYLLVSRVSAVAILRAVLYLPYHAAVILVLTSEMEILSIGAWSFALSAADTLFNALVDSRLLALVPVAAVERTGVFHSIRRCWQLTSRHWTRILGVLVLVGCFWGAIELSSSRLLEHVAGDVREHDLAVLLAVATGLGKNLITACWAVVAAVCYRHARVANGEIAPEEATVPPTA